MSSLSPVSGPATGNTFFTINGANLGGAEVKFGGLTATGVTYNSAGTVLTGRTPAQSVGNKPVVATTAGGSATVPGGFTYTVIPVVAGGVSPSAGPIAGGTTFTIRGTGFVPGSTTVTIGGVPVAVTVSPDGTTITGTTPPEQPGTQTVVVTTPGGTVPVQGGFTYAASPSTVSISPAAGPVVGGTAFMITGTGFTVGSTTVTIGGVNVPVTVNVGGTVVSGTTPEQAAGNKAVVVTTPGGTTTVPGGFTYTPAPVVSSGLNRASGPVAGGTPFSIVGANLIPGTTVTIGGVNVPVNVIGGGTVLSGTTPPGTAGNKAVVVSNAGGSVNVPGGFTYIAVPVVSGRVSPSAGPVAGGTIFTITGSGFPADTTVVAIDGIELPVTVSGDGTVITGTTPPDTAGNKSVVVITPGGSATVPGGFTYTAQPTSSEISPAAGPIIGGTQFTITGTGFTPGATTVTIGGVTVPVQVSPNGTSLTGTIPAQSVGNKAVVVTTPGGSVPVPGGFTYAAAPSSSSINPPSGPVIGRTEFVITGTGFTPGTTTVTIGGFNVPVMVGPGGTTLSGATPAQSVGNKAVVVTTPGGTTMVSDGFTYAPLPVIRGGVSPNAGPVTGGTTITITGSGFTPGPTTVAIDGKLVPVTVSPNGTTITGITPPNSAGRKLVFVGTPGGAVNAPGGFTYVAAPTAASITPTVGPTTGGIGFSITGTNFTAGTTTVTIGSTEVPVTVTSGGTIITGTLPAEAPGNKPVVVTTPSGSANVPGGFTYTPAPTTSGTVVPAAGPVAGGTFFTITGTNLDTQPLTVTFGGNPATGVTVNGPGTTLTGRTPPGIAGNQPVVVITPGGRATITGGYTYTVTPVVDAMFPATGPTTGGTQIAIFGSNFTPGTTVTIGGINTPVTVGSGGGSLIGITPPGQLGEQEVDITTPGGTVIVPGGFTYALAGNV